MVEAQWDLFVGVTVLVTIALLMLARATQRTLSPMTDQAQHSELDNGGLSLTPGFLLVNVAFSHGVLGVILVATAWYARIPRTAFGVAVQPWAIWMAIGFGIGLYVANEVAAAVATRWGVDHDEHLRELLAPESWRGWVVLLGGVLPVVAGVEEVLFRAALIGVPAMGFGWSPWGLAVISSVAFGVGHGLQGPGGIVVTGLLGFALAAVFVVSGSLLIVIVAHYMVNALEFVVHEGLHLEPFDRFEGR